MTTAREIVTRAHRKIGVVARDEALDAADAAEGINALNMMLAAWKLAGVDISHTALALSDTVPLASEFEEGTVYMLASRLAPDFAVPQSFDADDFMRKIQAAYMIITASTVPTSLTRTPSRYWPHPRIR